ncbi:hypothetical protein ANANG_G00031730 [Anguilla anguilla]|uniref:Uncharacterized protein n=1 Tax=Anguilla anguilla TaxID=7936 RepID=A0A9D3MV74_ANGAN|nr:hypothetical protein ANANG_G00031730 [Anguilla anguilla]
MFVFVCFGASRDIILKAAQVDWKRGVWRTPLQCLADLIETFEKCVHCRLSTSILRRRFRRPRQLSSKSLHSPSNSLYLWL